LELCECEEEGNKREGGKTEIEGLEENSENDEENKYKRKLKEMYDKI